ncbi:MAG: hypothetical protein OEM52_12415 [bacterium]|nr:hypothetical protein [bacterium]
MNTLPRDRDRIDIEVQAALDSFDSLKRIEASPFFYARLKNTITDAGRERTNWLYRITQGYKLLPAALLLITILNVFSLSMAFSHRQKSASSEHAVQDSSELLYSLSRWSMYNEMGR